MFVIEPKITSFRWVGLQVIKLAVLLVQIPNDFPSPVATHDDEFRARLDMIARQFRIDDAIAGRIRFTAQARPKGFSVPVGGNLHPRRLEDRRRDIHELDGVPISNESLISPGAQKISGTRSTESYIGHF